jgi:hypothetical protein
MNYEYILRCAGTVNLECGNGILPTLPTQPPNQPDRKLITIINLQQINAHITL